MLRHPVAARARGRFAFSRARLRPITVAAGSGDSLHRQEVLLVKFSKTFVACAVAALGWCFGAAAPAARAEPVDNPQYTAWSGFAVGSNEVVAGEAAGAGPNSPKMTMETTRKLVEKTDDH